MLIKSLHASAKFAVQKRHIRKLWTDIIAEPTGADILLNMTSSLHHDNWSIYIQSQNTKKKKKKDKKLPNFLFILMGNTKEFLSFIF